MTVLVIILLLTSAPGESTGTYTARSLAFPSKDMCEGYRQAVTVQASAEPGLTLVSQCSDPDAPVVFNTYGRVDSAPGQKRGEKL